MSAVFHNGERDDNKFDDAAKTELIAEIRTILEEAIECCTPVYELLTEAVARFEDPDTWVALLESPLEAQKARGGFKMLRKMIRNGLAALDFAEAPDREKLQVLLETSGMDQFVPDEDIEAFGELVDERQRDS